MKVVNLAQRSDAWYEWRNGGISASEIAAILDRNKEKTRWRLWAENTGKVPKENLDGNPNVRRGIRLEDKARQAFEARHEGEILMPLCVEYEKNSIFRASLDGITGKNEPTELKCPHPNTMEKVMDEGTQSEAFQMYLPQVQHQMLCTDAKRGYLVFYSEDMEGDDPTYLEFPIDRDDAMIQDILREGEAFWNLIETRKEPLKDPLRDIYVPTGEHYEAWDVSAGDRLRLMGFLKAAEKQVKTLKDQMKINEKDLVEQMGEFMRAEASGLAVTRFHKGGTIDYPKLLADLLPDLEDDVLEKYRRKGSDQVRIVESKSTGKVAEREESAKSVANSNKMVQAIAAAKKEGTLVDAKYNW